MARQNIPYITPTQLREQPDQTVNVLNNLIRAVNELQKNS